MKSEIQKVVEQGRKIIQEIPKTNDVKQKVLIRQAEQGLRLFNLAAHKLLDI